MFFTQAVGRYIMQSSDQQIMNLEERRRQNNNGSLAVHLFLSLLEKNPILPKRKDQVFNFRYRRSRTVVAAQLERISLNAYFRASK